MSLTAILVFVVLGGPKPVINYQQLPPKQVASDNRDIAYEHWRWISDKSDARVSPEWRREAFRRYSVWECILNVYHFDDDKDIQLQSFALLIKYAGVQPFKDGNWPYPLPLEFFEEKR